MAKLFIEVERDVPFKDKMTRENRIWDHFFTKINNLKVTIKMKGTVYEAVDQALRDGQRVEIIHHMATNTFNGNEITSDQIFAIVDGEEAPIKADAYGKSRIIKALDYSE